MAVRLIEDLAHLVGQVVVITTQDDHKYDGLARVRIGMLIGLESYPVSPLKVGGVDRDWYYQPPIAILTGGQNLTTHDRIQLHEHTTIVAASTTPPGAF